MTRLKAGKAKTNDFIKDKNKHLMDITKRRELALEATLASFMVEGVSIPRETALEIARKVEEDLKRYTR